jgi:four helix bundle protein
MARYKRFEDLPVWQEAERLYGAVLDLLEGSLKGLSHGFRNQIDRASLSVSNNIAEGFDRMSTAQLLSFLETARGSVGEVRSVVAAVIRPPRPSPFDLLFAICYLLFRKCYSVFSSSSAFLTPSSRCLLR